MKRQLVRMVIIGIALASGASPALAGDRLALVIGNSDYTSVPPLANPAKDASLIAGVFRDQGFDVREAKNLRLTEMSELVRQFARDLALAGRNAAGVIYYAGHGMQIHETNYLIPVEAKLDSAVEVKVASMSLNWVLDVIATAGNSVNIVILDACRDNPFKLNADNTRGGVRGLARADLLP